MRAIETWFNEYGESHQNPTNKMVHWICVPVIFFCVVTLFSLIKLPVIFGLNLSMAHVVLAMSAIFYINLSWRLAIVVLTFAVSCLLLSLRLQSLGMPVFTIALLLFVAAWIGQFWGHHIEGKKPSFLKDLQFLLIGPLWLLGFIYRAVGLKY